MFRRLIAVAVVLVFTSIFMWSANGYISAERNKEEVDLSDISTNTNSEILVWYIGDEAAPYLEDIAATYRNGVSIDFEQKSSLEFFENIDKLNRANQKAPDLYIIDSELLEKACYAGLAKENPFEEIYTAENYSETALASVTYKDALVGYPLYFQTAFLAYNADYVKTVPNTFDDILEYAESGEMAAFEGLENVLKWDVKNLLYNYAFVGGYLNIGGENGDDASISELSVENLTSSLTYYQSLSQYFSIDINTVDNNAIIDEFVAGKTAFILTGINGLSAMNQSGINYGISNYPNVSDSLITTSMSATKVVVVNPYSKNVAVAEDIAKYMSYDQSEKVFEKTGTLMGTRELTEYMDKGVSEVMKQYTASESLPKLMDRLDLYIHLGNTLNSIWTGSDVATELSKFQETID